tara:strand:- start:1272 stop:1610 length:339 start_codon:yes stop_codon:yes gene_type:complete
MAETIEKITRTDPEPKKKFRDDPDVQIQKLRFWARLIISLLAFGLFGWLIYTMVQRTEELTQSSKDLINLGFGAFLPILGMLGKHWFESSHESIGGDNKVPPTGEESSESKE